MRSSVAAIALLAATACGPKAAAPAGPKAFAPEPEYAALFEKGKTWTFVVTSAADIVPEDPEATELDHVEDIVDASCTVAEVVALAGGVASRIECEFGGAQDPLGGAWVADATGAYHLRDEALPAAGAAPTHEPEQLRFTAPVTERQLEEETVTREGDAWCWSWSVSRGDEAWSTVCIDANGPTKGSFGWAGATSEETSFERKR